MRTIAVLSLFALAGCLGPDHIQMEPNRLTFTRKGDQVWEHAIFMDSRGKSYPRESATWSSSDEKVAKVDNVDKPGNVTAVGPGHAVITVKGHGLSAELPVDVVLVEKLEVEPNPISLTVDGDRVPLVVKALDSNGAPLRDRKPLLKCANEKVCTTDSSLGIWPAGEGATTVQVTVDDKSVTIPVVVQKHKK